MARFFENCTRKHFNSPSFFLRVHMSPCRECEGQGWKQLASKLMWDKSVLPLIQQKMQKWMAA
jgi:hypothetical protein